MLQKAHLYDQFKNTNMQWVDATEETPPALKNVFIKGTYRGKEYKLVGFYNPENKKFYTNGSKYSKKKVKWLKE